MEDSKNVMVPMVEGRMIENATGTNKNECLANLAFIELTDDEWNRLEYKEATLTLKDT
jgi:hypothetical protein